MIFMLHYLFDILYHISYVRVTLPIIKGDNSYSYMYNLGDFYDFDYSYLFDNSTDYDSMIPTWDYRAVFKLFVRHEGFSFLVQNTCI